MARNEANGAKRSIGMCGAGMRAPAQYKANGYPGNTADESTARNEATDHFPASFFAISVTCRPWKRAIVSSLAVGWRSPLEPAIVLAP